MDTKTEARFSEGAEVFVDGHCGRITAIRRCSEKGCFVYEVVLEDGTQGLYVDEVLRPAVAKFKEGDRVRALDEKTSREVYHSHTGQVREVRPMGSTYDCLVQMEGENAPRAAVHFIEDALERIE